MNFMIDFMNQFRDLDIDEGEMRRDVSLIITLGSL